MSPTLIREAPGIAAMGSRKSGKGLGMRKYPMVSADFDIAKQHPRLARAEAGDEVGRLSWLECRPSREHAHSHENPKTWES